MATKWRLNRAETAEAQSAGDEAYEKAKAEGAAEKEAQELKTKTCLARQKELQIVKQQKCENKKKGAAASSTPAESTKETIEDDALVTVGASAINSGYYEDFATAKDAVLSHHIFKDIESKDPLPIDDKSHRDSGVQARTCTD